MFRRNPRLCSTWDYHITNASWQVRLSYFMGSIVVLVPADNAPRRRRCIISFTTYPRYSIILLHTVPPHNMLGMDVLFEWQVPRVQYGTSGYEKMPRGLISEVFVTHQCRSSHLRNPKVRQYHVISAPYIYHHGWKRRHHQDRNIMRKPWIHRAVSWVRKTEASRL